MECSSCPFNGIAAALAKLTETVTVTAVDEKGRRISFEREKKSQKKGDWQTAELDPVSVLAHKARRKEVRNAAEKAAEHYGEVLRAIEAFMPYAQQICLACSRVSDDDNLSHSGQTFVSMDAMASASLAASCQDPAANIDFRRPIDGDGIPYGMGDADNGEWDEDEPLYDPYDNDIETRTAATAHNYLQKNAIQIDKQTTQNGGTKLPLHIEEYLLKLFHSFAALSVFDQMLVLSQLAGQSFTEFGTMKWVPKEFQSKQSKQMISQRWSKLVSQIPVLAALKERAPSKDLATEMSKHYAEEDFEQGLLPLMQF